MPPAEPQEPPQEIRTVQNTRHPLEAIVFDEIARHGLADVTSVSVRLMAAVPGESSKIMRAYRIVAADVLKHMEHAGSIVRTGAWARRPEDGGPAFSLPPGTAAPPDVTLSLAHADRRATLVGHMSHYR